MSTYEKGIGIECKYWIPTEDKRYEGYEDRINITLEKKYEILEQDHIIDDAGVVSEIFNHHKGVFVN